MAGMIKDEFFRQVLELFQNARKSISASVNITMVYSYYEAGRMIIEEEQNGKERAENGKHILQELSMRLANELGRGFSVENLKLMRRFYKVFSKDIIDEAVFLQSEKFPRTKEGRKFYLGWSQYLILMRLALEGQTIETPKDILKDPYVLEFTGLPEQANYSETELETKPL